jgi:hypothetical protein
VILRAVVGSTVHGTAVSDLADRDEMAIVIEPTSHVIGLHHWETTIERTQPDHVRSQPGDLDLTYHSLRKYCRLTARGNPTMLLPLFVPQSGIVEINTLGAELIAKRDMFLSKEAGEAFLGYMHAQGKRLRGEQGQRHGAPRSELIEKYGFDTKYAGHIVRLGLQGIELMETGRMSLPMQEKHREEVLAVRTGLVSLDWVFMRVAMLETLLKRAIDKSCLPALPNSKAINAFLVDAYCRQWGILWHRLHQSDYERDIQKTLGTP